MKITDIDFNKVECYRGETLENGRDGTRIYLKDGLDFLLPIPFGTVRNYEELLSIR